MVWTYEKDDKQQTTKEDIWMIAKRTEEKGKTETNLDTGYDSNNKRMGIGGWDLRRQGCMESSKKFMSKTL